MAQHFFLDGVELDPDRVRLQSDRPLTQTAEITDVAGAGVQIEDPDGDLAFNGWKTFMVTEDDCTEEVTWVGYIGPRRISHGDEYWEGSARVWDCDLYDINAIIGFRVLRTATAKRPYETETARMTWLLGSEAVTGLVFDNGFIDTGAQMFDEADFRGQFAINVIGSMGSTAKQGYVFWDSASAAGEEVTLWYDVPTSTSRVSTLRLTNVLSEVDDSVTFAVTRGEEMTRDPSQTFSGVYMTYRSGTLYQESAGTAASFIARDGIYDSQRIGRAATAASAAANWLAASGVEQDRITCTVRLPATHVNLILAGQLLDVHFSHLPGYEADFVTTRVARRTVRPTHRWDAYDLDLELNILKPLGDVGGGGPGGFPPGGGECTPGTDDIAQDGTAGALPWNYAPTDPQYINDNNLATSSTTSGPAVISEDKEQGWSLDLGSAKAVAAMTLIRGSGWPGDKAPGSGIDGYGYTATAVEYHFRIKVSANGVDWTDIPYSWSFDGSAMHVVISDPTPYRYWAHTQFAHPIGTLRFMGNHDIATWAIYELVCEDTPPAPGQPIDNETVGGAVDGANDDFTTSYPFADGTLIVTCDGIDVTDCVSTYDGAAGTFTLNFAPRGAYGDEIAEKLLAHYLGR